MSLAFYYHPDGYETSRANLMGRHVAGESFLKACCQNSNQELYCYASEQRHFDHFLNKVKQFRDDGPISKFIPWTNWRQLEQVGTLFMPGPNIVELAWQRRH